MKANDVDWKSKILHMREKLYPSNEDCRVESFVVMSTFFDKLLTLTGEASMIMIIFHIFQIGEIPENLRSRDHITQILRLDEEASEAELTIERSADIVLRDLKRLYEGSIKPLEGVYKYRDLSNRHFGDPEIFSKPLVLFMGPWSGGKSSIVNYLTGLEFTEWSLRTGKSNVK